MNNEEKERFQAASDFRDAMSGLAFVVRTVRWIVAIAIIYAVLITALGLYFLAFPKSDQDVKVKSESLSRYEEEADKDRQRIFDLIENAKKRKADSDLE